jgi:uncharacterized protein (DUF58 family)
LTLLASRLRQWLFQLRSDEPEPIVLRQRRIFIVPTKAGLLYAAVLCTMLVGAINYNLSLGHALVFLLAGIGLVAMLHTFRNLALLEISGGHASPVFAGETAHFTVYLKNTRAYSRRSLALSFDGNPAVFVDVAANARAAIAVPCPATQRGRLAPGRITLASQYPVGLFHAWSYLSPRLSCLVYPRPIMWPLPGAAAAAEHGEMHGPTHAEGGDEDFTGLRERQPNDSPRHIAWKAVARDFDHRPLLVKEFAGGTARELWLAWSQLPAASDRETRLSILAGWVVAAQTLDLRYGLRLPGAVLPPAQGPLHYAACLEALALHDDADDSR